MFDAHTDNQEFDFGDHGLTTDLSDASSIIRRSKAIPLGVRTAAITRKFERRMDHGELQRLTNPQSLKNTNDEDLLQLRLRRRALRPYLGSSLTCVLIRLPGVCYTIEIDMIEESVVHWEYQTLPT